MSKARARHPRPSHSSEPRNATAVGDDFPERDEKWELLQRSKRLRLAVDAVGGNRAVSNRSGVAYGTLNDYLAGGEMKVSNAVALAEATGVSLEWLLTGRGPMRPDAPDIRSPRPVARHRLPAAFDDLDVANLSWALSFVESQFGREGPTEARVKSMLLAANEFRRVQRMPLLPPLDELALADSLYLVEKLEALPRLMGRPTSTEMRIRRMLGAYEILLAEEAESEEKPTS